MFGYKESTESLAFDLESSSTWPLLVSSYLSTYIGTPIYLSDISRQKKDVARYVRYRTCAWRRIQIAILILSRDTYVIIIRHDNTHIMHV